MAVTKIWAIKDSLQRVLNYAANPDKTEYDALAQTLHYAENDAKTKLNESAQLVTGIHCRADHAWEDMRAVQERFGKTDGVVALHAYQSFREGEVTPEQCHEIGVALARKVWGGRFQVLVATHMNTDNLHNHFVINSVSYVDGKKYEQRRSQYAEFRETSDKLCREYGLSVVEQPKAKEPARYARMREAIDQACEDASTAEDFHRALYRQGYIFSSDPNRRYATIRARDGGRAVRLYRLGEEYDLPAIDDRLRGNYLLYGSRLYELKHPPRQFKITICNGYKVNGQKRMKAQTITVPSTVPKRGIQQYVMAEAERIEKKFKYGVEESDQTHFEQYAENWLKRQQPFFKATTYAGYKRNLDIVYPLIGGIPLAKLLPMRLEEMCEELRKRPGRGGNCIKETTVQKYLETVSSVLEDAKKNDIIPFNPAHRVRKKCVEKEKQHIPQKYEMQRLLKIIMDEPILYKAYYTMAIATGLRRGELCALRWEDITGPYEFAIRHSRSYVAGQGIVESDTKNHRERVIVIPAQVWEFLMSLRHWKTIRSGKPDNSQPIFTDLDGHVPNPDTFTRHLRKLYAKNGFPKEYHLHTLRHYYATYLLQEGTSKQVAADLLGHADTAFLERTYCHPQNMAKREVANLMDDLLSPKNIYYQPYKFVRIGKKVG